MDDTPEGRGLARWVEAHVGGRVVRIERLARWRAGWNIDVELDGQVRALHARGEREPNFAIPNRIADEAPIHDLLEAHGLPVPHAYGICDEPYALVMDRLAGDVDLTFAADDDERTRLLEQYLSLLPVMYAIGPDALERAGLTLPADDEVELHGFHRWERVYDALMVERDPVAELLRSWLHRNLPHRGIRPAFVTFDAFQFMFDQGGITGLLDFELACVGDPLVDLASLRVRDTIKNLGDLPAIAEHFTSITGIAVDHDAVDSYTVLYNTLTVLSAGPPIEAPMRTTDLVSHLAWYVNSARWAFEVIADMRGFELDAVKEPAPEPTSHGPAYRHLVETCTPSKGAGADGGYEASTRFRLARHLRRVDEIGAAVARADGDDLADLLGARVPAERIDAELLALIDRGDPELDEPLVRLLDRRVQRQHLLLGPPGSLMLRHPRLRTLRPDRDGDGGGHDDDAQRWPAGAIPGTR